MLLFHSILPSVSPGHSHIVVLATFDGNFACSTTLHSSAWRQGKQSACSLGTHYCKDAHSRFGWRWQKRIRIRLENGMTNKWWARRFAFPEKQLEPSKLAQPSLFEWSRPFSNHWTLLDHMLMFTCAHWQINFCGRQNGIALKSIHQLFCVCIPSLSTCPSTDAFCTPVCIGNGNNGRYLVWYIQAFYSNSNDAFMEVRQYLPRSWKRMQLTSRTELIR